MLIVPGERLGTPPSRGCHLLAKGLTEQGRNASKETSSRFSLGWHSTNSLVRKAIRGGSDDRRHGDEDGACAPGSNDRVGSADADSREEAEMSFLPIMSDKERSEPRCDLPISELNQSTFIFYG